jgi:hypothetical protein
MLSLEVMGPGGSLSTVLIATPYRRDTSWRVSWQAATATVAQVATGRLRRSSIGWEVAGGCTGGADWFRRRRILNFYLYFLYVYFYIRPFLILVLVEFIIVIVGQ